VARFLSPEWVEAWNTALSSSPRPDPGPEAGLAMADGHVTVVQEIHGTPDGDVRLVLRIDDGSVRLEREAPRSGGRDGAGGDEGIGAAADVTIVVAYDDAAAMSRGELSPAQALTAGRIRVRGDLSCLAATQQLLNDVRASSDDRIPPTTY
jgi:putative sterol carrier protein